ncbi:uncharacterized protein CTRU02_203393 [Colletotrichum truncatum]|uniref:Uncharacterized protein n=1 Tax=Colletotrichum truncatum TaxID=5467 RepID=A0ACC3Z966_COLTU|nr:uncharacterized protein CTRU02_05775 [Colletotrichum truncatum]KAF6793520.1 hypothetical protein CTRU02_05775 [Colletotrichum truncatum]
MRLESLLWLPAALAASVTFLVPSSPALPNPYTLPPSTRATLSTLSESFSAPLSVQNTFVFNNVTAPGSYLVDVHCATHAFAPVRLDVAADGSLSAWETYRGNDWDNKGEVYASKEFTNGAKGFELRVLGGKNYFVERSKFSVFTILKNPMILLGLVSMGIFIGMPYLVDNMDPEMRAEFEERQKSNPMNSLLGGGGAQPGANPMGNFDMAAFLAGSGSNNGNKNEGSGSGSSNGGGNGKKEKAVRR